MPIHRSWASALDDPGSPIAIREAAMAAQRAADILRDERARDLQVMQEGGAPSIPGEGPAEHLRNILQLLAAPVTPDVLASVRDRAQAALWQLESCEWSAIVFRRGGSAQWRERSHTARYDITPVGRAAVMATDGEPS